MGPPIRKPLTRLLMSTAWTGSSQSASIHMSSIFRPVIINPPKPDSAKGKVNAEGKQEALSKSQRLLLENGLIRQSSCNGAYHLLPLAVKSLEKLVKIIDMHMQGLRNCQKIQMPTLTSVSLWKATGRLEQCHPELMKLEDRHAKEFLLSPTHEEAICDLLRGQSLPYRQLPRRFYQITDKFRDEKRPRFGLLRTRQFLMKDLYTFDANLESATRTYDEVNEVYEKILNCLDVEWIKARGTTGTIGGSLSHEFHIYSDVGEDVVSHCTTCGHAFNMELLREQSLELSVKSGSTGGIAAEEVTVHKCQNCESSSSLSSRTSIEVAHSFLLRTKYTKPLQALYVDDNNKKVPMEMGCFGIGVSRLLAAVVEEKSLENELRWSHAIAPYLCVIVPPKRGSKEEEMGSGLAREIYDILRSVMPNEVIYDDRTSQTIGKRLMDIKRLGIPFVVVCGKEVEKDDSKLEFHDLNNAKMSLESKDSIIDAISTAYKNINNFSV